MGEHRITLLWNDGGRAFTPETYPREYEVTFKNGQRLAASAAPAYRGDGAHADPEEMLVAALSGCHMLTFLALCAKKKLALRSYADDAVGFLSPSEDKPGKLWISRVILRPQAVFTTNVGADELMHIHHLAHEACFIANSVKTEVRVEPR